jgi:hypothetical protein
LYNAKQSFILPSAMMRSPDVTQSAIFSYRTLELGETVGLTDSPALHAGKAARPSQVLKLSRTGRVIREDPLKLQKRRREPTSIHANLVVCL